MASMGNRPNRERGWRGRRKKMKGLENVKKGLENKR